MTPWMHQGPSSRAQGRRPAMDPQNPSLPFPGLGFVVGLQIYASMRERGMGWLRGSDRLASGDRRRRWRADMETVAGSPFLLPPLHGVSLVSSHFVPLKNTHAHTHIREEKAASFADAYPSLVKHKSYILLVPHGCNFSLTE
jgi:hypothetical protein